MILRFAAFVVLAYALGFIGFAVTLPQPLEDAQTRRDEARAKLLQERPGAGTSRAQNQLPQPARKERD